MSKVYKYVITHNNCPIKYIKNLCNRLTFKVLNRYNLTLKEFFKTSFYKNEYFKTTLIFLNLIEKVKIKKI